MERLFPGIFQDEELLRLVLAWILSHEFKHCAPGDGGTNTPSGNHCDHLKDKVDDCTDLCNEINTIKNDENLSDEEKRKRAGALCTLHKYIADGANSKEAVEAARNCSNVTVTNDKVVQSCSHRPTEECPVHGTTFGNI